MLDEDPPGELGGFADEVRAARSWAAAARSCSVSARRRLDSAASACALAAPVGAAP